METNELEQLRSQMTVLQQKLDRQRIVNEQVVRRAVNSKMLWIKSMIWVEMILLPFILFLIGLSYTKNYIPMGWAIYLAVIAIADILFDYRINQVGKPDFIQGNQKEVCERLLQMKRARMRQVMVEIPLLTVWLVWLVFYVIEGSSHSSVTPSFWLGIAGCIWGIIVGAVFAVAVFRKMQRTNDEMIRQLRELQEE